MIRDRWAFVVRPKPWPNQVPRLTASQNFVDRAARFFSLSLLLSIAFDSTTAPSLSNKLGYSQLWIDFCCYLSTWTNKNRKQNRKRSRKKCFASQQCSLGRPLKMAQQPFSVPHGLCDYAAAPAPSQHRNMQIWHISEFEFSRGPHNQICHRCRFSCVISQILVPAFGGYMWVCEWAIWPTCAQWHSQFTLAALIIIGHRRCYATHTQT